MADDKTLLDPVNLEGMAYGIFESAQNVDQGRAALFEAYNSNNWTDEAAAKETLSYYGEQLKYKFRDYSEYSPDFLFQNAPVTLLDLNPKTDEDYENLYDNWEKENLKYLDENPDPFFAIAKTQLKKDISKAASESRRKAFSEDVENTLGETGGAVVDTVNRFAKGALSTVDPLARQVGINLNDRMTEITDPDYDKNFGSQLSEGLGQGAGLITLGIAGGGRAVGASVIGQGTTSTVDRYREAKEITGDTGQALKGAAIEAVSQTGQALIDIPLFGKLAKGVAGKLVTSTAEAFGKEAISEGVGQIVSNVGENVSLGQDPLKDAGRGAARAAVIGGIVAGGISASANYVNEDGAKVVSESNSGVRAQEVEEFGGTLTPTTKQTIGPVHVQNPDFVSDTEGATHIVAEDGSYEVEDDYDPTKVTDPTIPAFETEDGSSYLINEEGKLQKRNPQGGIELPFDHTVFLDEATAKEVNSAIEAGGQVIPGEGGIPTIETAEGEIKEIPYSMVYSEGTVPLEYSEERKPNKDTVLRPMRMGQRVRKVFVDRSLGAAGGVTQEQKESQFSQRLRQSANLPESMRRVGEEGIFHDVKRWSQYDPDIAQGIREKGVGGVLADYFNGVYDNDTTAKTRVGVNLINAMQEQFASASEAEDFDRLDALDRINNDLLRAYSADRTPHAQALGAGRGINNLEGIRRVSAFKKQAYEEALQEVADEEGLPVLDIAESEEAVQKVDQEIGAAQEELNAEVGEEAAIDDVIQEIETQAQADVEQDNVLIDQEAEGIEQEIQSTDRKARKEKDKDIQAIEESLTQDQVELANAISTGQELSQVTAEERGKLEDDINKQLESAETKTNSLVKSAVAEERKRKQLEQLSQEERLNNKILKAKEGLNKVKTKAKEQITKLKLKLKGAQAANDATQVSILEAKIQAAESKVVEAADRVREAEDTKAEYDNAAAERQEAERESNDLLEELEQGVRISISPQGRGRKISVVSKRSGLDITKLFRRGDAAGPLAALSRGVGDLANVFSQGGKTKNKNNERIKAISDRIKENKKILDQVRQRDHLSDVQKKRIAQAKKRLETLKEAKTKNTLEKRLDKPKYKKYKAKKEGIDRQSKSSRIAELEGKLQSLNEKKARAQAKTKSKDRAKKKAAKAIKTAIENEQQIERLEALIKDQDLKGATRQKLEQEILARKAVYEKDPATRDIFFKLFTANNIGSVYGILVGTISSGFYAPIAKTSGLTGSSLRALVNTITKADTRYQYPILKYLAGFNPTALGRGLTLAKGVLKEGTRLKNTIPTEELVAERGVFFSPKKQKLLKAKKAELKKQGLTDEEIRAHSEYIALKEVELKDFRELIDDYLNYVKTLPPGKNPLEQLLNALQISSGYTAGMMLRVLGAAEAVTYTLHDSGMDRASAAFWYNKGLREGVSEAELQVYKYDPKKNWKRAQEEAAYVAKQIRDTGLEMSAHDERILATEKYQEMRPRAVQIDAFKQASQVVLNAPAPGYAGVLVYHLNQAANDLNIRGARPLKYLTPFANSIAQNMQLNMEMTPLGFITALSGKEANRTEFERSLAISSATVGTTLGAALALYAIAQLDDKDRWFDIIGQTTQEERDAGMLSNSIRIVNYYLPFGETPFALLFGGIAGVVDKVKKGKEPDMGVFGAIGTASASAAGTLLQNMNMLRGVSDIFEAIKAGVGEKGNLEDTGRQVARTLIGTVKGFVPAAGILRNISRMFEKPVESRKDIKSALVEGIPGLQSAFGKPALNVFGEPMLSNFDKGPLVAMHRIFSTKRDDIDIRWLSDNGYEIPGASAIKPSKATGDIKITYDMKYDVMKKAAPEIRAIVAQFRQSYGSSAYSKAVQKQLNTYVNKVLAKYKVEIANDL